MPKAAYHLTHPERRTTSVVFASPHSGRDYPWTFLRRTTLNEHSVRSSEDAFVDQLFDCAPRAGAPFIRAGAPRAYVDLNRSADELDPALIEGVSRQGHNPEVRQIQMQVVKFVPPGILGDPRGCHAPHSMGNVMPGARCWMLGAGWWTMNATR